MMIPSNGIILVRGESGVLMIPSSAGLATDLSLDCFSSVLAFPTARTFFVSDEKALTWGGGKLSRRASRKQSGGNTHKTATRISTPSDSESPPLA